MKKSTIFILILSVAFAFGCKKEVKQEKGITKAMTAKKVKIKLEPKSDSKVKGNIAFTEEGGSIRMVAIIEGLEPRSYALQIHEKADCSANDGSSAGAQWKPVAIDSITPEENGRKFIEFSTKEWCLGCEDPNKDILGKAIIIQTGTDDAAIRVSCGGIIE